MAGARPADAVWLVVEVVGLWAIGVELARQEKDGEIGERLDETGAVGLRVAVQVAVEDAGKGRGGAEEDESIG